MKEITDKTTSKTFKFASRFLFALLLTAQTAVIAETFHCVSGDKTFKQNYQACKQAAKDSGLSDSERAYSAYKAGLLGQWEEVNAPSAEILGYLLIAQEGGILQATLALGDIYKDGYRDIQKNAQKASSLYESIIAVGSLSRSHKKALLARAEMRFKGQVYEKDARAIEDDLFRAAAIHDPADELDLSTIGRYYGDLNSPLHNRYVAYFWKYLEYKQAVSPIFKGMFYTQQEKMAAVLEPEHVSWITKQVDQNSRSGALVLPRKIINYVNENSLR